MSWTVQIEVRPTSGTGDAVPYLPVEEVATVLRKNRRTIDRYIASGVFTQRVIYGVSCVPSSEVTAYVAAKAREAQ